MKPQTLSTKLVFNGSIFDVRTDRIREGELEYSRDIVVHKGSAVIVPVFDDGTVALVRQYRHAAGIFMLEVPAGSLEIDEDPLTGAIRELEEEVGVVAENVELITEFYVSPGSSSERISVFWGKLGKRVAEGGGKKSENENIRLVRMTAAEAYQALDEGKFQDAKTIIALLKAKALMQNKQRPNA